MRFVTISLNDLDRDKNGVVTATRELMALLEADGHTVWAITPANGKSPTDRMIRRLNFHLRNLAEKTRFSIFFYASLKVTTHILSRRMAALPAMPQAVIAHDALTADAAFRAFHGKVPVLLVCHFGIAPWLEFANAGLLPKRTIGFRLLKGWIQAVLANPGIDLVAVSRKIATLLHEITPGDPSDRVHVAYTGVSAPGFPDGASRPKLSDPPVLINVGRLDPWKNQRILPDVAAELVRRGTPCRFVLVGPNVGDEQAYIMERARRRGVEKWFTLTGPMERQAVWTAIHDADMYLHTSSIESFGLTLVEAIAVGTPVMAMAYDAISEVLPDTPEMIISRQATPADMADRIIGMLSDREKLADIQSRQRRVYECCFSPQAFRSAYLDLLTRRVDG